MMENLMSGYLIYWLIGVLFVIGIHGIIQKNNFIKKIMAMNIMQVAVIIFFLVLGQKTGATLPILIHGVEGAENYINPLPHALMLTAIVVSLSTTGVALALLLRIQKHFDELEEPDVLRGMDQ
ncbi:MAG: NADH-ubiquinone oxidoreductase, chain [Clostridiales bacterium]|jgi:multicomponent Na+:H+ antiporter subunit C|nr:NADH-ubiquinone oxidoreductase, chain [Clostridiales bacterium]